MNFRFTYISGTTLYFDCVADMTAWFRREGLWSNAFQEVYAVTALVGWWM